MSERHVVSARLEVHAPAAVVFELVADPAEQPRWDGNDNLAEAAPGQRVRAVGDVFRTVLRKGSVRENHVVEFEEGRLVAWCPASEGQPPAGHLWRWELTALGEQLTLVEHTYDWSGLQDPSRTERARSTTSQMLAASIERLAALAQDSPQGSVQGLTQD